MLYIVKDTGYEHTEIYILVGPKVEDWQAYCKTLMPEALEVAKTRFTDLPIGENDLIWGLVQVLLREKGYRQDIIETATFWTDSGLRIFDEDDENDKKIKTECSEVYGKQAINGLLKYNRRINEQMEGEGNGTE